MVQYTQRILRRGFTGTACGGRAENPGRPSPWPMPRLLKLISQRSYIMRILLLTAATGAGHIKAANAVEAYIRENTGWDVRNVDCLKAVGRLLDKTVCDSYLFMAK